MATQDEIAAIRRMIAEQDETTYADAVLAVRIDASDSLDALAAEIWSEKAASYSKLVNISESGSSRSMGDLYKNAMTMSKFFSGKTQAAEERVRGTTRLHTIQRP